MGATKVGRSQQVSGSGVPATASAYVAMDAIGVAFAIPEAAPNRGALLANALLIESGSASAQIRAHFYSKQPSGGTDGVLYIVQPASGYLGFVDFINWVSAHGSAGMSQNEDTNIALRGDTQSRVWCQFQALTAPTFNAATTKLLLYLGVLQD